MCRSLCIPLSSSLPLSLFSSLFSSASQGRDHRIDEGEFFEGIKKLQVKVSQDEARKEFGKIDTNGGGQILFDEFCRWLVQQNLSRYKLKVLGGSPDLPTNDHSRRKKDASSPSSSKRAHHESTYSPKSSVQLGASSASSGSFSPAVSRTSSPANARSPPETPKAATATTTVALSSSSDPLLKKATFDALEGKVCGMVNDPFKWEAEEKALDSQQAGILRTHTFLQWMASRYPLLQKKAPLAWAYHAVIAAKKEAETQMQTQANTETPGQGSIIPSSSLSSPSSSPSPSSSLSSSAAASFSSSAHLSVHPTDVLTGEEPLETADVRNVLVHALFFHLAFAVYEGAHMGKVWRLLCIL